MRIGHSEMAAKRASATAKTIRVFGQRQETARIFRAGGKHFGRPLTVGKKASQIRKRHLAGVSKAEIARQLNIGRTSVRRILGTYFPEK